MSKLEKRVDGVGYIEVVNSNPNGDPDFVNHPRQNPHSGKGLITSVCIKRKIRHMLELKGQGCYVKSQSVLNLAHQEAHDEISVKVSNKPTPEELMAVQNSMCTKYADIRLFGAVMSTKIDCGTVIGPVQVSMAESEDKINPQRLSITRCAITTEADAKKQKKNQTCGEKYIVPYGLYRFHFCIRPERDTGMSEDDYENLLSDFTTMFDHDESAARFDVSLRYLFVFEHSTKLGTVPKQKLFSLVKTNRTREFDIPEGPDDYKISVDVENIPSNINFRDLSL